jgi:hypothetical protein
MLCNDGTTTALTFFTKITYVSVFQHATLNFFKLSVENMKKQIEKSGIRDSNSPSRTQKQLSKSFGNTESVSL